MECEDHYCFCLFNINIYTQIDTDNIYIYIQIYSLYKRNKGENSDIIRYTDYCDKPKCCFECKNIS